MQAVLPVHQRLVRLPAAFVSFVGKQLSQEASAAQNVTKAAQSHPTETNCFHTSSLSSLLPLRHKATKEMHVRVRFSLAINMEGNNKI